MRILLLIVLFSILWGCSEERSLAEIPIQISSQAKQDSIIEKYLKQDAWQYGLYSKEYRDAIDQGLAADSTVAYLWQQRAMPLFKQGKYELGMSYLDKAVALKPERWQDYRAFIKCIFAKTYQAAIEDFQDCKAKFGNNYVMDHSYDFYIALCHLQLNEFQRAEQILKSEIGQQSENLHYLNLFYYGISKYEQGRYKEAIDTFDEVLKLYPQFSDVQYYKAICLSKIDRKEEVKVLLQEAKLNSDKGYTINEDNAIYERYPYQVRW